ncbi:hypothetical protein EG68_07922 [Paragonimus skrjabini miyazakii]|uniref:Uncharacterized protein n=1 Tax=Paragonimus skrjabini miyazakii TaxID=59628 RepID=A0A8S9YTL7_9TREM|nr:hypothetical protein EG68_07922 [Paragonimus skrjabini miyazakii]
MLQYRAQERQRTSLLYSQKRIPGGKIT